jgi:hypothetical protein
MLQVQILLLSKAYPSPSFFVVSALCYSSSYVILSGQVFNYLCTYDQNIMSSFC